jgi:hypothetical protein
LRQPNEAEPSDRRRPGRYTSQSYLRAGFQNPYDSVTSNLGQFPFASRVLKAQQQPAPLFQSTREEFQEDGEEEREREVQDYYALQKSRRDFADSHLTESTEGEEEVPEQYKRAASAKASPFATVQEEVEGKGKLVDVGLDSRATSVADFRDLEQDDAPPDDIALEMPDEDEVPAFQQWRKTPSTKAPLLRQESSSDQYDSQLESPLRPRSSQSETSTIPPSISALPTEPPRHDAFWGNLFMISLASLLATFFLVYLHTSEPKKPLGDTLYATLHRSFHLLAVDTLVACIVSLLWLSLLRSFMKPLILLITVAVPIILFSFSLYPFISSFKGPWRGESIQDRMMRWLSLFPFVSAVFWTYTVYQGRHSLAKAIGILEFSCRILVENPALLMVGFSTLGGIVVWTWIWMWMFSRVFLGGHFANARFIVDVGSWWLGVWFILNYLWTLAVISGIQRATTAATVSQWYFHRRAIPAPTSRQVVQAALTHATTTLFGTISLSTLLALVVRLPLLVLPKRVTAFANALTYTLLPTPIIALTNPLTLTYAAIHSQPLSTSARGLSQLSFLAPVTATTALTPRRGRPGRSYAPLLPYRLAKLLLNATRLVMAIGLGFVGWVSTAHTLRTAETGSTFTGSLYAYVVGLIAGAIGWGVLGATEGVLGGIVDAVAVCWGSETRGGDEGAGYCLEAARLFGNDS